MQHIPRMQKTAAEDDWDEEEELEEWDELDLMKTTEEDSWLDDEEEEY